MHLTELERNFINHFQGNFPLQARAFYSAAQQLNCDESELIESIQQLKAKKLLTRFGPLFDASRLGGGLTLAAISVPDDRYDIVTEQVNSYPEVAHNYRREHQLNMWFVLATETTTKIEITLSSIEQTTGLKVYNFPKLHEFYIGLWLHLSATGQSHTIPVPDKSNDSQRLQTARYLMDETDRKLIRATQKGLPIEQYPYLAIAKNISITETEVLLRLKKMLACDFIRRIGAVPNHYKLGLIANGMTVWNVRDDALIEMGNIVGKLNFVSHCYQRPRHLPLWPYNLFAMVHGHSRGEVEDKVQQIKVLLGADCRAQETLYSSAILKKTGMRLVA